MDETSYYMLFQDISTSENSTEINNYDGGGGGEEREIEIDGKNVKFSTGHIIRFLQHTFLFSTVTSMLAGKKVAGN